MVGNVVNIVTEVWVSLKVAIRATAASFLCWPLAMATMISGIPERHQHYSRSRLLDVSEMVNDGVLERIAPGFSPMLQRSENVNGGVLRP